MILDLVSPGSSVLDLGCGWGSVSLFIAERFPDCSILSVSNSASQGDYIREKAAAQGLDNIAVVTADMNEFDTNLRFERIVSVEMFEHMRNYEQLFRRIHGWLEPGGRFFMHIFTHRSTPYEYIDKGPISAMRSIASSLQDRQPVAIFDVSDDPRIQYPEAAIIEGIASILSSPIIIGDKVVGCLRVYTAEPWEFTLTDVNFVQALAQIAGILIEMSRLYKGQNEYIEVLTTMRESQAL